MDNEKDLNLPECFVIMPIADHENYDTGHFRRVYEDIFKIACKNAGYKAIRADDVKQTNLIHLDILKKLLESPMAICDLSCKNPNVMFELGLRQAFDKPTVLVTENDATWIFDIAPLRHTVYRKNLKYREVLEDQKAIAEAITATKKATDAGEGVNSIVSLLSLSSPASLKELSDQDSAKMFQVIMSEMNRLRSDFNSSLDKKPVGRWLHKVETMQTEEQLLINVSRLYNNLLSLINKKEDQQAIENMYKTLRTEIMFLTQNNQYSNNFKTALQNILSNADQSFYESINIDTLSS